MAIIARQLPHYVQPQYAASLDLSNPLVAKHSRIYSFAPAWPRINLVTGAATSGTPDSVPTQSGLGANFNGSSSVIVPDSITHTGAWTAWALVRTVATSGVHNVFSYGNGTGYAFQLRQNGANFEAYQYSSGDKGVVDTGGVNVGEIQFIAASWDGISTLSIWRDRVRRNSIATVASLDRVAANMFIGRETPAVQYWSGQMLYFGLAPAALTDEELLSLNNTPTQIFQPRRSRLFTTATTSTGDARNTQQALVVLGDGNADARSTQAALAVLADQSDPDARNTQLVLLSLDGHQPVCRLTQSALLVLGTSYPCVAGYVQCWRITRTDGVALAYTTHDTALAFGGSVFQPCKSLRPFAFAEGLSNDGSSGDFDAVGIIDDAAVSDQDIYAGLYDGATVEVYEWDWLGTEPLRRLSKGRIFQTRQADGEYTLTASSALVRLGQNTLLDVVTPSCSWRFGDARCTIDVAALTDSGTVTATETDNVFGYLALRNFTDASLLAADGYYNFGKVLWTSGANVGVESEVKDFALGGFVTLWDSLPNPIAVGDTYAISPGCDLSKPTCKNVYGNYLNFGGFDDVPGVDSITDTPNASQG